LSQTQKDRQVPQASHVERLILLALVGSSVTCGGMVRLHTLWGCINTLVRARHSADNALFVSLLLLLISQDHNLQMHRRQMIISASYVRTAAVPPRTVHGNGHVWLALVLERKRQPCA
jgi:hypothetical protein